MTLPKFLTTITPFSKLLALFLFILFPIVGFYVGMTYQQSITLVNQPELLVQPTRKPSESDGKPTPIVNEASASGWKTFQSKYGYLINYPPDWEAKSSKWTEYQANGKGFELDLGAEDEVVFTNRKPDTFYGELPVRMTISLIRPIPNPEKLTLQQWLDKQEWYQFLKTSDLIPIVHTISINNHPALIIDTTLNSYGVFISYTGFIYSLEAVITASDNQNEIIREYKTTFDRILSTLKFINLCNNCPRYASPPPGWCEDGTPVGGKPIVDGKNNCYCPGPPICQKN